MQQPMPNPKDITDPTTAMNMELVLMARAFKLNNSTPTNNNKRISSNPRNRQITQPVQNLGVQNVGNQNGVIVVSGTVNQNRNGNVVATRAKGNASGNNDSVADCQKEEARIQLQAEEFDLIAGAMDLDEIEEVNANYILMANLQQASTSGTPTDKAPVYDSDRIAENDSNVSSRVSGVEQEGGIVEQHSVTIEETRAYFESLYDNFAIEVKKVNTVNRKLRETNVDLTTKLASFDKQITTLNELILKLNNQLSKEKPTVSSLQEEKKRLKSDFKIREDKLLDKKIQLENKIKELDKSLVKTGQSIQTMHMLPPKPDSFYHTE
ncbi:hypothetical protein Tco_0770666 [Tanacetum coccineum]|uniref:Gag-Pol polyprotein n=1 Tax=Tanacetum coccineum TaxID=301880 RepID=A0ABQ4ZG74_9ASTR